MAFCQVGHWTYECKNQPVYQARPTRTKQLTDPKVRLGPLLALDLCKPHYRHSKEAHRPPLMAAQWRPRFLGAGELLPGERDAGREGGKGKDDDKKAKKKKKLEPSPSSDDSSSDSDSDSSSSDSDSSSSSGGGLPHIWGKHDPPVNHACSWSGPTQHCTALPVA